MGLNRLSALDAAFLSLESAQAPMHVGWAALFSPPPDGAPPGFEAIRSHVEGRLSRAPRYRQRLAEVPLGLSDPVWVDDEYFDIAAHVRDASCRDFSALVDEVLSTPLSYDRPLWELWIVEGLQGGMLGVVGKAHHCLVDGLGAVELMALLLDLTPQPESRALEPWVPHRRPAPLELLGRSRFPVRSDNTEAVSAPLCVRPHGVDAPPRTGGGCHIGEAVGGWTAFAAEPRPEAEAERRARALSSGVFARGPRRAARPGSPIRAFLWVFR